MTILRIIFALFTLLAAVVVLGWLWLLHTNAGARFLWAQAESALDGALVARQLSGDLGSGVELAGVSFSDATVDVEARRLRFAADIDLLPLSLRLSAVEISSARLAVRAQASSDETDERAIESLLESLALPFWVFVDDLTIRDLSVALPDTTVEIDTLRVSGAWRESLRIDELHVATPNDTAAIAGRLGLRPPFALRANAELATSRALVGAGDTVNARAALSGDLSGFTIDVESALALTGFDPLQLDIKGRGSRDSLVLDTLSVSGEDLDAAGTAEIRWQEPLRVAANIVLAHANPNALLDNWPAGHPVSGALVVEYAPGQFFVRDTRLAIRGTESSIDVNANLDISTNEVTGEVSWVQLQWPVASTMPDIRSRAGSVRVAGTTDDWRVRGRMQLAAKGIDEGTFSIDGEGDRERASVTIEDSDIFGGHMSGVVSASWVGQRPWSAIIDLKDVNTGPLVPDWPAVVSGHIDASGHADDRSLRTDLRDIGGTLRGRVFTASGGIDVSGDTVIARKLVVGHGNSRIVVDGDLYAKRGLDFSFTTSNIGELFADAAGDLQASGKLSLNDTARFLRLDASSERIGYGDLQVTALNVSDASQGREVLQLVVAAEDLSMGGEVLVAPLLRLGVTRDRQSLEFTGRYKDFAFDVGLLGALDRWTADSTWRGELSKFVIDPGEKTAASLTEPAALSISKDRFSLQRMCMTEPGGSLLCADIAWSFGDGIDLTADISDIPVDLVNGFRDTGFTFDQLITGRIRWQQRTGQRARGGADISLSPGSIQNRERPQLLVTTQTGKLVFDIEDGKLLSGALSLPMPGTGSIDGVFSVLDVTDAENSPVEGHLDLVMQDIALIALLSPLVDEAEGRVQGAIDVTGTFASPLFAGTVALQGGSVSYLPLGLRLTELELAGELHADQSIDLEGTFRAGRGRGEILTRAGMPAISANAVRIELRGNDLTVIDVPDLKAVANLDVDIGYADETLTLGGKILIPHARVRPKDLVRNRETVSDDVVIVAGRLPETEKKAASAPVSIRGLLEISLGDDVSLDLDLAEATLTGAATYEWSGSPVPVANGRYAIAGDIEAFGQVLTVVEGGVRFPNVPANNPSLRIRAEREIFGNSQIKAAGVLVTGTIARPTIEAYTYPASTEERALTLLVTGSDFNYEQGVGAVAFGTYVAPKLFVSYGVGLFGRDNVISARYDLASGFGIKATSGQQESGIDFIYRFER